MKIPKSFYDLGDRVLATYDGDQQLGYISGINFDHNRDQKVNYTVTCDEGYQSDGWTDETLTSSTEPPKPTN